MNRQNFIRTLFSFLFLLTFTFINAQNFNKPDTLRLFLIGNSFSQNAARYLPQLAEEGNHPLIIGRAEKALQPDAQVVFHQTWAYRSDSRDFSLIAENQFAKNAKEMWQKSKAAYQTVASDLGINIMPVGDAFQKVAESKKWAYQKDAGFNFGNPVYPQLPDQKKSLHQGYFWDKSKKLGFDSHHANEAGCFLGSLVWYRFLFGESTKHLKFVPKEVPENFAEYLKKVTDSIVRN